MGTLIQGGKVVSARETPHADVLIEGETIAAVGARPRPRRPPGHRRHRPPRPSRRHRRPHPPRHALRRHRLRRRLLHRHPRRGHRRHHHGHRLLPANHGQAHGPRPRDLEPESRRQSLHRLLACTWPSPISAPTTPGSTRSTPWSRHGITSFKIFMAYPNVLMVDDRTIYKLMERTKQLGALVLRARRKRHRHRRHRAGGARGRQHRPALSRPHPPDRRRGRGRPPRRRDQRAGGRR